MASYISSNNNRLYAAVEPSYGAAAAVSALNAIPAVALTTTVKRQRPQRRDKTGTRTYPGEVSGLRSSTDFEVRSYLCSWGDMSQPPPHGALVQAALGAAPQSCADQNAASCSGTTLTFQAAHGLSVGQSVCYGSEIRFVAAIVNDTSVQLNVPFTAAITAGMVSTPTMTYSLAEDLPSATIFDYWTPATGVQRLLSGAAVDKFTVNINGDFHELTFGGSAADLIDSGSFQPGQGGLSSFPAEAAESMITYSLTAGHLGQAWLGILPWQALTITSAQITVNNDLQLRNQEFGFSAARGISPGMRTVSATVSLFAQDDQNTMALYQAARQRSPMSLMMQLGQQQGQLMGIYMKSIVPEVPAYDDSQRRLQWKFQNCRAQGSGDDELFIGFA